MFDELKTIADNILADIKSRNVSGALRKNAQLSNKLADVVDAFFGTGPRPVMAVDPRTLRECEIVCDEIDAECARPRTQGAAAGQGAVGIGPGGWLAIIQAGVAFWRQLQELLKRNQPPAQQGGNAAKQPDADAQEGE